MPDLAVPTVHLNGTSKEDLLDTVGEAMDALDRAYAALKLTAPNGRDYYVQGSDAIRCAVSQHSLRLQSVDEVKEQLSQIYNSIYDQGS